MEGITESQAAACGEETDSRHAKGPCQVTLLNGDLNFSRQGSLVLHNINDLINTKVSSGGTSSI